VVEGEQGIDDVTSCGLLAAGTQILVDPGHAAGETGGTLVLGITLVGSVRSAEQGGVVELMARTGEPVTVTVLPFVSSRYAVRAAELVANTPAEHTGAYDQRHQNCK